MAEIGMVARSFHRNGWRNPPQHISVLQTSHISTDINGGSGVPWSRDARCRGFVQWDMAGSASSLYQRSILWRSLRLDSTLTQFMGGCRWLFSIATCWEQ